MYERFQEEAYLYVCAVHVVLNNAGGDDFHNNLFEIHEVILQFHNLFLKIHGIISQVHRTQNAQCSPEERRTVKSGY